MTTSLKYASIGFIGLLAGLFGFGIYISTAHANPSYFMSQNNGTTITATTSMSYMTPGTATTTYYFDAGQSGAGGVDNAIFAAQFIGSSTPNNAAIATTTYNIAIEYAMGNNSNCITTPSACDWYSDAYFNELATTSLVTTIVPRSHQVAIGSQTLQGNRVASTTATTIMFNVPAPTRYIRAVVSIPSYTGSTNGAVWATFIAKRQAN